MVGLAATVDAAENRMEGRNRPICLFTHMLVVIAYHSTRHTLMRYR